MPGFLPPVVAVLTGDNRELSAKIAQSKAELSSLDQTGSAATRDVRGGLNDVGTAANDAGGALGSGGLGGKLDETSGKLDQTSKHSNVLSDNLGKVGKWAMLGGGALVAGIGAGSIKMAGNFQQAMTQLVTGAGEAQTNIKMVTNGILAMAPAMGKTPTELAQGMYLIESAGFHGAAGLAVLRASAEGASVGNAQLATVSNAVTTALHDYHLPAAQAAAVTSALVETVARGKTHMQDLATSLGKVMPVASALGIKLPVVTGAIATMTNAGLSARFAATHLQTTLLALSAPSSVASKALVSVGLSAQQVKDTLVHGGLPAALTLIQDKVGTQFPKGSVAYVTAMKAIMGGTTGYSTALMLGGKNAAGFQANVRHVGDALGHTTGQVQGFSKAQKDLNFQFDALKSQAEALMIKIGGALMPAVLKLAPVFGKLLTAVAPVVTVLGGVLAKALVALMPSIDNLINNAILPLARAFAPVLVASMKLVPPLVQVVAAFVPLIPLVLRLLPPLLDVAVVIARLAADILSFKPIVIALGIVVAGMLVSSFIAWAAAAIPAAAATIAAAAPVLALVAAIAILAIGIYEVFKHWRGIWTGIKDVVHWAVEGIVAAFHWIVDTGKTVLRWVDSFVHSWGVLLLPMVGPIVFVATHWKTILHGMERVAVDVWHGIDNYFVHPIVRFFTVDLPHWVSQGVKAFTKIPGEIKNVFAGAASWLWQAGVDVIKGLVNGITAMIPNVIHAAQNIAGSVIHHIGSFLGIGSPSKITHQHGLWLMQGLANGIAEGHSSYVVPQLSKLAGLSVGGAFGSRIGAVGPAGSVAPAMASQPVAQTGGEVHIHVDLDHQELVRIIAPDIRAWMLRKARSTGTVFGQYGGTQTTGVT